MASLAHGLASLSVLVAGLAICPDAGAQTAASEETTQPTESPEDARSARARQHFLEGVELVKSARWSEALASFEASTKLRPHPVTTFNIGACQRAMGYYTLARRSLHKALAQDSADSALPDNLKNDAKAFLAQIESTLARVKVTVIPPNAAISVDGRPLERETADGSVLLAGVRPPGKGVVPARGSFDLVMDPGAHVMTLSRKGFADVVVNRSFSSGRQPELRLELAKLPATLRVSSNVPDALVYVNDVDLGPTPVDVRRPAGTHRVRVSKSGFDDYQTVVTVSAGEQADLQAKLASERIPLTKRWWFWAGAGAVVVGGVVLTYALTRPDPEPPPYDGGSTGWVASPSGIAF